MLIISLNIIPSHLSFMGTADIFFWEQFFQIVWVEYNQSQSDAWTGMTDKAQEIVAIFLNCMQHDMLMLWLSFGWRNKP